MNNPEIQPRKPIRLIDYDYTQNGMYFVTICAVKRRNLFWDVGAIINRPRSPEILSEYGIILDRCINEIPNHYSQTKIDKYVIMPNHVHIILRFDVYENGRFIIAPTSLSTVIKQLKRAVTRGAGIPIWQKSFYDHIIRNNQDYLNIWQYIDNNPARWAEDEYYSL